MGEPSTSDYDQEIPQLPVSEPKNPAYSPRDDSAHQDSGASGSQSLPVEDHFGGGDYHGSPQIPVPDTPEIPSAAAAISDDRESPLSPLPASTHPPSSESRKEPDYQENSTSPASGTPVTSDDLESAFDLFLARKHLTSSECPKESDDQQSSVSPVSDSPETSTAGTSVVNSSSNISGSQLSLEAEERGTYVKGLIRRFEILKDGEKVVQNCSTVSDSPEISHDGTNVSPSSSNIPVSEVSGEAAGIGIDVKGLIERFESLKVRDDGTSDRKKLRKIDDVKSKKTPVLAAENAMLEGSFSGQSSDKSHDGDDDDHSHDKSDEDGNQTEIPSRAVILQSMINYRKERGKSPLDSTETKVEFVMEYFHGNFGVGQMEEIINLIREAYDNEQINDPQELRLCKKIWGVRLSGESGGSTSKDNGHAENGFDAGHGGNGFSQFDNGLQHGHPAPLIIEEVGSDEDVDGMPHIEPGMIEFPDEVGGQANNVNDPNGVQNYPPDPHHFVNGLPNGHAAPLVVEEVGNDEDVQGIPHGNAQPDIIEFPDEEGGQANNVNGAHNDPNGVQNDPHAPAIIELVNGDQEDNGNAY